MDTSRVCYHWATVGAPKKLLLLLKSDWLKISLVFRKVKKEGGKEKVLERLSWHISFADPPCLGTAQIPSASLQNQLTQDFKNGVFLHLSSGCFLLSINQVWLVFCKSICKGPIFPNH